MSGIVRILPEESGKAIDLDRLQPGLAGSFRGSLFCLGDAPA
jgi:hypothetical protein